MVDNNPNQRNDNSKEQSTDSADKRPPKTTDSVGSLLTDAIRSMGRILWLVAQAIFIGITTVFATFSNEKNQFRIKRWLLLSGERWKIILIVVSSVFLITVALGVQTSTGFSNRQFIMNLFSSIANALILFTSLVLSLNQLVVTRLTGTPQTIIDDIKEIRNFRQNIANRTQEQKVLPTAPSGFTTAILDIISARAQALQEATAGTNNAEFKQVINIYLDRIARQVGTLEKTLQSGERMYIFSILLPMLEDSYAEYINLTKQIQVTYTDALSQAADNQLEDLKELFTRLDATRQYFKILFLYQDLGRLSRQLTYTGLIGVLLSFFVVLLFSTRAAPRPGAFIRVLLVAFALAMGVLPLVIFFVYALRFGTIVVRTSAPGAFTLARARPESAQYQAERLEELLSNQDSQDTSQPRS